MVSNKNVTRKSEVIQCQVGNVAKKLGRTNRWVSRGPTLGFGKAMGRLQEDMLDQTRGRAVDC